MSTGAIYVRRWTWAVEEKRQIVNEAFGGAGSVSSVARRHGLQTHQIYRWRDAFRAEAGGGAVEGFMPVEVSTAGLPVPAPPVQGRTPKTRHNRSERNGNIEIRLADGTVIKVPVTAGAACIAGLMKGLSRGAS